MKIVGLALVVLATAVSGGCKLVYIDLDADRPYERVRMTAVNYSPFPVTVEKQDRPTEKHLLGPRKSLRSGGSVKLSWYNQESYDKQGMVTVIWHRSAVNPNWPDRSIAINGWVPGKYRRGTDRFVVHLLDPNDFGASYGYGGSSWVRIEPVGEYLYRGYHGQWYANRPLQHRLSSK
jgi:hypothetical protein